MAANIWKMSEAEIQHLTEKQTKDRVLQELDRILQSEYFRGSKRCCNFLKYSVGYMLDGRPLEELKERIIGVEAFHKQNDYDTAQDNIVRVTANEVRKRLAQYYGDPASAPDPLFHLSSGTYAVSFHWRQDDIPNQVGEPDAVALKTPASQPRFVSVVRRFRAKWLILAIGILVVAALAWGLGFRKPGKRGMVREVWSPVIDSPKPVAISIVQPVAYRSVSDVDSDADLPSGPSQPTVAVPYESVGIGDAFALANVVKVLSERGKTFHILPKNSTPFQRLHTGSAVLIGNHTDIRLQNITENQRFFFASEDNAIHDRSHPEVRWSRPDPASKTGEDYAIVSRFTDPTGVRTIVVVAGLTNAGTRAAGDFITSEDALREAFRNAPKNRKRMNFQFVLHVKAGGSTVERPMVIASEFW